MDSGIHVQLAVEGVSSCPVTSVSETVDVESITTSRQTASDERTVVGEFTVSETGDADAARDVADRVFSDGAESVYRYTTDGDECPCGRVPTHGCPVRDVSAESGTVVLSFIAPSVETLRAVVTDLRSCCESVRVRRLTHSTADDQQSLLVVDRTAFTDRQYEVLQTAHEMGYFAQPKESSSTDVAARLGISVPTFSEHLAVSQRKLMDQLLDV
ncbi:helix-turn-helix domain-containing protein [Halogranum rubrum]|uniref:Bacterio-opsin activator-like protein n=1 Tax=Halogranum salarium B-1 TaxID=1210908 RepID=J3JHQ5_9EURY|nr:helix-turn-helix domain-containing protein [Halogranum salarium]EJN61186.1 bacterio-opsin activator-like protein [Halogranum salarium B-1]